MRRLVVALTFLGLCLGRAVHAGQLPTAKPEEVGVSSQRLERIGTVLKSEIAQGRMPGAVVAVVRRGKVVYFEAFGNLDKPAGTPMPKDAIFAIASMTKPIVTTGAMMLFEEGKLSLDEPIATYLPELKNMKVAVNGDPTKTEEARRQPTVEDLLRHTSGFTTGDQGSTPLHRLYPLNGVAASESSTGAQLLARLAQLPLHHQPGTTWDYSFGLDLVGLIIERVSGQSLGGYLRSRIFEPLHMTDTAFVISQAASARQAKALPTDPVTGAPQTTRDQTRTVRYECGGGCLASTASDYIRFAQMLLQKGAIENTRILGPKTVEYMTSDHATPDIDLRLLHTFPGDNNEGFGFGLGVAVRRSTGYGGTLGSEGQYHWPGSQGTAFWVDPKEDLAIVYMAQTTGAMRRYYRQLIPALVYQAINE